MTDAITRQEKLLAGVSIKPITREEMFLAKLAGQNVNTPEPITRKEKLMQRIIDNGISGGGDSYYDTFWDAFQQNGNRRHYGYGFAGNGWNDETFKPKYPIIVGNSNTDSQGLFMRSKITTLKNVNLDLSKTKYFPNLFDYCIYLLDVPPLNLPDGANAATLSGMYSNCYVLETVELYNLQNNIQFTQTFNNCHAIKNLILTGTIGQNLTLGDCKMLSNESVQNVIDCLADYTGTTARTLTLHADVKAKLSDEQIATITSKNWNLA